MIAALHLATISSQQSCKVSAVLYPFLEMRKVRLGEKTHLAGTLQVQNGRARSRTQVSEDRALNNSVYGCGALGRVRPPPSGAELHLLSAVSHPF